MREINQKKTKGERPMCMCEVVFFLLLCWFFFRLISSRCSFVIRLFCDWFYAFCSTTLAYTVFKYGFNRLCCVWTFLLCKYTPDPTENKQQLICSLSLSLCVCWCLYVCAYSCLHFIYCRYCCCCFKQSAMPTTPLICIFHLIRSLHSLWKHSSLSIKSDKFASAATTTNKPHTDTAFHIIFFFSWNIDRKRSGKE